MILHERIDLTEKLQGEPLKLESLMVSISQISKADYADNVDSFLNAQINYLFGTGYLDFASTHNYILNSNDGVLRFALIPPDTSRHGLIAVHGTLLGQTEFRDYDKVDRLGIAYFSDHLFEDGFETQNAANRRSLLQNIKTLIHK